MALVVGYMLAASLPLAATANCKRCELPHLVLLPHLDTVHKKSAESLMQLTVQSHKVMQGSQSESSTAANILKLACFKKSEWWSVFRFRDNHIGQCITE